MNSVDRPVVALVVLFFNAKGRRGRPPGPLRTYSMIALRVGRWLMENRRGRNTLPLGSFGTLARRLLVSMRYCRSALGFVSQKIKCRPIPFSGREFSREFRDVGFVSSSSAQRSTSAVVEFVRRVLGSRSSYRWVHPSHFRISIHTPLGSFGAAHNSDPVRVFLVAPVSQVSPF
jgi:hypothetical protein